MEEKKMTVKIIGAVIGALVLGFGLFYLIKEKNDAESRKIYGITTAIGGILLAVMLVLTIVQAVK